jgi:small subunit ribosomal protein S12
MVTYPQLKFKIRKRKKGKNRVKMLNRCPQKKGVCTLVFIMTPKKPNSAKRKVVRLRIYSLKKYTFAYIPGIGHTLQKFSHVLIRGGLIRDLPGVHYTIIRGKLDLKGIEKRRQGRSKYGNKLWWRIKKKDRISARQKYKKERSQRILAYLYGYFRFKLKRKYHRIIRKFKSKKRFFKNKKKKKSFLFNKL